jgi:hypothetical protein
MSLACVPTDEDELYVVGLFYLRMEWSQASTRKYGLEVEPVF